MEHKFSSRRSLKVTPIFQNPRFLQYIFGLKSNLTKTFYESKIMNHKFLKKKHDLKGHTRSHMALSLKKIRFLRYFFCLNSNINKTIHYQDAIFLIK